MESPFQQTTLQTLRQDSATVCELHLSQASPLLYLANPHLDGQRWHYFLLDSVHP